MTHSTTLALLFALTTSVLSAQEKPIDVPISADGSRVRLIGKLQQPLGAVVTVQGFVVDGLAKGNEDGPNLRVQRINGKPTQADIQIKLSAYFNGFGEKAYSGRPLPALSFGKTYVFEGYETGEFVGRPSDAYQRAGIIIQTSGFYFSHQYVVYDGKQLDPIVWSPADFIDQTALIAGTAANDNQAAFIVAKDWRLLVDHKNPWPKHAVGKHVEGFGTSRKTAIANTYRLENGTTRLVRLEDQLGRNVALRGTARSHNGTWWFNYRGVKMYVEGMDKMPGWSSALFAEPVEISGLLDEVMLHKDDTWAVPNAKLKKYYMVRKPSWRAVDALLSPEISSTTE